MGMKLLDMENPSLKPNKYNRVILSSDYNQMKKNYKHSFFNFMENYTSNTLSFLCQTMRKNMMDVEFMNIRNIPFYWDSISGDDHETNMITD